MTGDELAEIGYTLQDVKIVFTAAESEDYYGELAVLHDGTRPRWLVMDFCVADN